MGERDRHPGEGPLKDGRGGTVGLVSLGCPKNLVDSEVMLGRLQERGYVLVADARRADVIVVNTCAFIDRAKQESVDTILEMAREKEAGRASRLVVTGCLAQRHDEELRREIPEIDATLGTGEVDDIVRAVEGDHVVGAAGPPLWVYDHASPRVLSTPPWLAYVKISEGCDYTCTFCIIPTLRGRHRSRNVEDILAEARALAARGVREIVLVAQDSTRYGLDHGLRDGLAYLLKRLGRIDGIRWIRVMYAYPATLTDPILEAIASEEKVVKYVDIPLQHTADGLLRRMKRPTGRGNLLGMIERIRARVPGVAIRTSFIVGFPGETEEDFRELLAFVEAARFDHVGVFTYSDEEGTAAFDLPGRVPAATKEARKRRVLALQRRIAARRSRRRVGERVEVLVEGPHPESDLLLRGRTAGQAPDVDGMVIIADGVAAPGSFVTCEVTEAHPYDLVVRIVDGDAARVAAEVAPAAVVAG
ncbi:MAG TPA: 30S ribosomal protein S12 methylthiotransferase RimO [Vicinamibacteria bacterium]|nr:30S ribosomal protein S12 methylthiotransferase RimO [Vicinamibacteria bacterium]